MLDRKLKRRLKLRDLDTLMVVAQSGSMAKAAKVLSVSQPAVSKAISDMEHTLGVQLFDRVAKGIEPTSFGRVLLKWAAAVFDDLRQGVNEIEFLADPTVGEVRIGASEPMQGGLIPTVIDRLTRKYPRISVQVLPLSDWSAQVRELRGRNIDLQVGRVMQPLEQDLQSEILFNDRAFVVASPKHPLARRRRKLELADLVDELWSLPPATTNVAGQLVADAFRSQGLELPQRSVITPAIQVHCGLVATGRYLAVFPASLLQLGLRHMDLKIVPVRWPTRQAPVGITIVKQRALSPTANRFVTVAREVARGLKASDLL